MVAGFGAISLYIVTRLFLECIKREESEPIDKVRKLIVILGVLFIPLVAIVYLDEVLRYIEDWAPGTWALKPIPVAYVLVWLSFVVIDILYQFRKLSEKNESEI